MYPDTASHKSFVRQEHIVLAECQRRIEPNVSFVSVIWDCPINCTLKKPDLLYELIDGVYVWFEVDEFGHTQTTERILEIRSVLKGPVILVRINPNKSKHPMLKKSKRSNGSELWEATDQFPIVFNEIETIVFREIENIQNIQYINETLPPYIEIGFNYKQFPQDRGTTTKTTFGYIIN